jgi:hypothetical protein
MSTVAASHVTNPVWAVYDKLRSARLNTKYYGRRLQTVERFNFLIEVVLLASAPTSAIAGLWFLQDPVGKILWQWFGVIAAVAAVLKPVLGFSKQLKEFEGILSGLGCSTSISEKLRYLLSNGKSTIRLYRRNSRKCFKEREYLWVKPRRRFTD